MTRSGAFKLSILLFITFLLCLPELFPNISQIEFLCEPFDFCTSESNAQLCGLSDPACATETINTSGPHRQDGWYACESQMDLKLLQNNTSQSGEHVMAVLTMKAANLSVWNYSVFAFLNNTDLYTEAHDEQTLFYCNLLPDNSKCPVLKDEVKCQATSRSFLFYYHEHNITASPAELPNTQAKRVWLALVLTVVVVTILSVGFLIIKSCHLYHRKSKMVRFLPLSAGRRPLKKPSKQKQNSMRNVPDVSIAISSINDNLLKVADHMYKRSLSPIYEITEDEEGQNENLEQEQCNVSVPLEEIKQLHLAAQDHCQPSNYLHHRSNFSCSSHEEDA